MLSLLHGRLAEARLLPDPIDDVLLDGEDPAMSEQRTWSAPPIERSGHLQGSTVSRRFDRPGSQRALFSRLPQFRDGELLLTPWDYKGRNGSRHGGDGNIEAAAKPDRASTSNYPSLRGGGDRGRTDSSTVTEIIRFAGGALRRTTPSKVLQHAAIGGRH